jgi:hypothetical protein
MRLSDVDYIPRGTFGYNAARLALAVRFCRFQLRRALRDALLGLAIQ